MRKIKFISFLRASGAIWVLISHLLCLFWSGAAEQIWPFLVTREPLSGTVGPGLASAFDRISINPGSVGVAFFFLITGFLIIPSVEKYRKAIPFLKAKLLRIYPMYIVGFSITFFIIWLYTHFTGQFFPYTFTDWVEQASLIRVFLWKSSIDQISWTVVADVEFYILIAILMMCKGVNRKGFILSGTILAIASVLISCNMSSFLKNGQIFWYRFGSHLTLGAFCLTYMIIGTQIYDFYAEKIDRTTLVASLGYMYFLFLLCCVAYSDDVRTLIGSYSFSLAVFILFMSMEKNGNVRIFEGKCMTFIANISFPLFLIHGLNGYIMETALFNANENNVLNFILTSCSAITLAWILHFVVERPLGLFLKRSRV